MSKTKNIYFTSLLGKQYKSDLEKIMFFNPQQHKISPDIVKSIVRFGEPRIVAEGDHLRIIVGSFKDVQALFAFDSNGGDAKLIGFMIYTRTDAKNIIILQIAVSEEYSFSGKHWHQSLAIDFIAKLREIGRLLKGVERIVMIYKQKYVHIPINRNQK